MNNCLLRRTSEERETQERLRSFTVTAGSTGALMHNSVT